MSSARLDDKDLVDRIILDPTLKTFTRLVAKAGLVETLKSEGPYTIFAPNDAAFARLPSAVMNSLLTEKIFLRKFVSSHIVNRKVFVKDFKEGSLKSLSGELIVVKIKGNLTLNGAKVNKSDIPAANGIIHTMAGLISSPIKLLTK